MRLVSPQVRLHEDPITICRVWSTTKTHSIAGKVSSNSVDEVKGGVLVCVVSEEAVPPSPLRVQMEAAIQT